MIKSLAILITFGLVGAVWASEPVTVQVISAVYEKSITQEFDAKLKKTGLDIHKKVENGRYVVTLGTFKDAQGAQNALKKAQALVVKDAFVRPVNRHYVVADTKEKGQPTVHHQAMAAATEPKAATPSVAVAPATPVAAVSDVPSVATVTAAPSASTSSKLVVVSDCDRREMHKDEMAEAIQYYRNSPYHRFEPVLLQR